MTPLHNHAMELNVLGAIWFGGTPTLELFEQMGLRPSHFHFPENGWIYKAMRAVRTEGASPDPELVAHKLTGRVDRAAIDLTVGLVPDLGNFRRHGEVVMELAVWRDRQLRVWAEQSAIDTLDEQAWRAAADPVADVVDINERRAA